MKDEIENLIQRGRLPSRFIKKDGNKRARDEKDTKEAKKPKGGDDKRGDRRTPPKEDKPTDIIHMISGGIEKNGSKTLHKMRKVNRSILKIDYKESSAEEKWVEPITFIDDELWEVNRDYDDPMVITAQIGNFTVERIMVD